MNSNNEVSFLGKFYDEWTKNLLKINIQNETLAIHFGYYKKGIKTLKEAILNMNDYVAELLHLENKKGFHILDAGCGIGGTSIYLAKKYPNVKFTGISIAPGQIIIANKFAKSHNTINTHFIAGDYIQTSFSNNYFDGIFALESSCYASSYKAFINEMYRILKPGGILVVIDSFRKTHTLSPIMHKIYRRFYVEFGNANLSYLSDFEQYLKRKQFIELKINNISKNVRRSVLQFSVVAGPFYLLKTIRKTFNYGKRKSNSNLKDYYQGNTIMAGVCGLLGIIGYYGISAKKPKISLNIKENY
jgi:cyclopropane fatty-acyl-phospholipid synthase-like methyltransferase